MSAKGTSPNIWTEKDTAYLREAYAKGIDVDVIAEKLKRGKSAIYNRARYLFIDRDWEPVNKTQWTKRDIQFIKKNFHSLTNVQIAGKLGKKLTVVRNKCRELGLLHMELEYWIPEQVEYLKEHFRKKGDQELAKEFQVLWPKKKGWSKKHIEKKRRYLNLKRTIEEQFLIRTGRFNPEDYKDFNGKNFKIGKKRLWFSNGKYRWRIKTGKKFVDYGRYKWEKFRGPVPRGHKLFYLDGITTNTEMSNLACLTQAEIGRRVAIKNSQELSDNYIAGILAARSNDPDLKTHLLSQPELLEAKRKQLLLIRAMGKSKCKKK